MAARLVEEMSDTWKPAQYKDTYHDDLMRLINQHIKPEKTEVITAPTKDRDEESPGRAKVVDLMALLKRSVQQPRKAKQPPSKSERHGGSPKPHESRNKSAALPTSQGRFTTPT